MRQSVCVVGLAVLFGCGGGKVASSRGGGGGGGGGGGPTVDLSAQITDPSEQSLSLLSGSTVDLWAEFSSGAITLAPDTLQWSSSLGGVLGSTNPLLNIPLSDGTHTITVTGQYMGASASASLTVTVSDFEVRITTPNSGSRRDVGTSITFDATAEIAGASAAILVAGAPGGGERQATYSWSSSIDGTFATGTPVATTALTVGTHMITLTVDDSLAGGSGQQGSAQIQLEILPPNTAPVATITDPATCPVDVEQGTTLTLTGTVTDAESSGLIGSWTDGLTGLKRSGNTASFPTSVVGKHQIRFYAEDPQGASDTDICDVYVLAVGETRASLFPSTSAINNNLASGSSQVTWVGTDGSRTLVGSDGGLSIVEAGAVINSYDGADLAVDTGAVTVHQVSLAGTAAVIATDAGLAACSYDASGGAVSACAEISIEAYEDLSTTYVSTTLNIAAASANGLFLSTQTGAGAPESHFFHQGNSDLPTDAVQAVAFAGSTLYVGTTQGLCVVNDAATKLGPPAATALCDEILDRDNSLLPSEQIQSITVDGDDIWLGTSSGLVQYNPLTGFMLVLDADGGLADDKVNDVLVDSSGIVWAATDGGLSRFDPATFATVNFSGNDWGTPGADATHAVFVDANNQKWVGTDNGVFLYGGA